MSSSRSVDDLLIKDEQAKMGITIPPGPKIEEVKEEHAQEDKTSAESDTPKLEMEEKEEAPQLEAKEEEKAPSEEPQDDEIDEYGTKIGKPKLYTQDEVNQMIRDRLSRGKYAEKQEQVQEAAQNFESDPTSDDSWEVQLEKFVENTIKKVSQKEKESNWRQQEEMSQTEFETKFTTGMGKYDDFEKVVSGKPITTAMMMATRSMQDPAAFLYAASKQHPQELERIAKIPDQYAQIAEVGRLEERMKKGRAVTLAPKPSKKISGDSSDKMPERNIDQLINHHAKSKIVEKRR